MNIFPLTWDLHTIPTMTCRKAGVGLQDRQEIRRVDAYNTYTYIQVCLVSLAVRAVEMNVSVEGCQTQLPMRLSMIPRKLAFDAAAPKPKVHLFQDVH